MLKVALKGLIEAGREMERWSAQKRKQIRLAQSLALSKVGYQTRKAWAYDLKTGNLGLAELSVYHNMAGDTGFERRRTKNPLANLFGGITYHVDRQKMRLYLGFLGMTPGTAWQARIAGRSQQGYTWNVTEPHREALHTMGIHLRESTRSVRVPARDIIGTAYARDEQKIFRTLRDLFRRKMAGERI